MPLQIKTTVLPPPLLTFSEWGAKYTVNYAQLNPQGYGTLTTSSPTGLITDNVDEGIVVVVHAGDRSAMCNTHLDINVSHTMYSLIDHCVNRLGFVRQVNGELAVHEKTVKADEVVDIAVFRGKSVDSAAYDSFISSMESEVVAAFTAKSEECNHKVTFTLTNHPSPLKNGMLKVDKGTGVVTLLELPSDVNPPNFGVICPQFSYNEAQVAELRFCTYLKLVHKTTLATFKQFDERKMCMPSMLSNEGRELIRSVRERSMNEGPRCQKAIFRKFCSQGGADVNDEWVKVGMVQCSDPPLPTEQLNNAMHAAKNDRPCETCSSVGTVQCGGCKGAWYCSREHQKSDWKVHKGFCRKHACK